MDTPAPSDDPLDDLPDIIDIVAGMGREPTAGALSPSGSTLPTHLEPLAERARSYAEAASSANTRRA